ncbi:hypothetical protein GDO78_000107 [Eleutherodactylus coqui]|uniref:Uncharacterized protein n=1 Tax=Eleutherodactylus coqui TaxID=57060 RepID=A0A8J6KK54_ELECQ|nr:hypothetical protein GDO78_000107 [Eleutherodactylus coqui]
MTMKSPHDAPHRTLATKTGFRTKCRVNSVMNINLLLLKRLFCITYLIIRALARHAGSIRSATKVQELCKNCIFFPLSKHV